MSARAASDKPASVGTMAIKMLDGFAPVGRFMGLGGLSGIAHAFTTAISPLRDLHGERPDGHDNRRLLANAIGAGSVAWVRQVHGKKIVRAADCGQGQIEADAVMTDRRGQAVMCVSADCPILLLADIHRGAVAAVHCGWRGIAAGIAAAALKAMESEYGCRMENINAAISPAAGQCCYEVGPEVVAAIEAGGKNLTSEESLPKPNGKYMLNPATIIARDLTDSGLRGDNIEISGMCSICDKRFHSYRRDGDKAGRGGGIIAILA